MAQGNPNLRLLEGLQCLRCSRAYLHCIGNPHTNGYKDPELHVNGQPQPNPNLEPQPDCHTIPHCYADPDAVGLSHAHTEQQPVRIGFGIF